MDDLSEKEQLEQIRSWWSDNGNYVIAGIVLGVGAIFGYNTWQSNQLDARVSASSAFEALADEVGGNRLEEAEAAAESLWAEYPESVYADQARLAMARLYMDQGRDEDAASALSALVNSGSSEEMQLVGRLRLAKIRLYQGRAEEVEDLLSAFTGSGFGARYQETIGDARFALGDFAGAAEAYQAALDAPLAAEQVDVTLLQMKMADLPDPGEVALETSAEVEDTVNEAAEALIDEATEVAEDAVEKLESAADELPEGDAAQ